MASSSKKKKLQEMEMQDAMGVSRKKLKFKMSPKIFIGIKLALVCLIPIFYFVYSPLLILLLLMYVSLFFLSIMAEHSMNKSVIKKNQLHFLKIDSAVALIVIIISISTSMLGIFKKTKTATFENFDSVEMTQMLDKKNFKDVKKSAKSSQLKTNFINFCTLSTGERNVFVSSDSRKFNMGTMTPPEDFSINAEDLEPPEGADFDFEKEDLPAFDSEKKGMFDRKAMNIMNNIPLDYVSNSLVTTANTVLIFSVSILGLLSLLAIYIKKRKIDFVMNDITVEEKITLLSDDELNRILAFGEDYISNVPKKEIDEKIKQEHEQTLENENKFLITTKDTGKVTEEIDILQDEKPRK